MTTRRRSHFATMGPGPAELLAFPREDHGREVAAEPSLARRLVRVPVERRERERLFGLPVERRVEDALVVQPLEAEGAAVDRGGKHDNGEQTREQAADKTHVSTSFLLCCLRSPW